MSRPSWDQHFIGIAREVAKMGTCARRQVGCVLVDKKNFMLSTGMNGMPPGWDHCRDNPGHECPGADAKSGADLDLCYANHAEINALIHCPDVSRIHAVYTTVNPCISCIKALLYTGARRIVFEEVYPHQESRKLWVARPCMVKEPDGMYTYHRTWEHFSNGMTNLIDSSSFKC